MRALNNCTFLGRLGRDPEVKHLASGTCVVNIYIACDYQYKDKDGEYQTETNWIPATAFGNMAEVMGQYLKKGQQVYIEGRFKTDQWKDGEGNLKYFTKIYIKNFIMTGSRDSSTTAALKGFGQQFAGEDFDDDIPF